MDDGGDQQIATAKGKSWTPENVWIHLVQGLKDTRARAVAIHGASGASVPSDGHGLYLPRPTTASLTAPSPQQLKVAIALQRIFADRRRGVHSALDGALPGAHP